ncbi:nuclear transport factor 2 family protein, partial [Sinomonas sp. G460-2]|uniref:nuclear transport factor 2 family protein n=1 Tax=Sinomonas sp. G460-2 TaxID=3393464 RepID=UPI0039F03E71
METTTTTEVLDLVQAWASAELSGDVDAYGPLFADDFQGIGPVGFVLDKDRWAQRHRGDVVNEEFEILEPHVRHYGDTALVEAVQRQKTVARRECLVPRARRPRSPGRGLGHRERPAQRATHRARRNGPVAQGGEARGVIPAVPVGSAALFVEPAKVGLDVVR